MGILILKYGRYFEFSSASNFSLAFLSDVVHISRVNSRDGGSRAQPEAANRRNGSEPSCGWLSGRIKSYRSSPVDKSPAVPSVARKAVVTAAGDSGSAVCCRGRRAWISGV